MAKTQIDNSKIIKLNFVDQRRWDTFYIFNADSFPEPLSSIVSACGTRLALFRMESRQIPNTIKREKIWFEDELSNNWGDLSGTAAKKSDPETWAYSDGLSYILLLYSSLTWLKSFLDVYTRLMCKLIAPKEDMNFNKEVINGQKLSGGKFINWLRNNSPKSFHNAQQLSDLIEVNSRNWITQAVSYRDVISHRQDLDNMQHMNTLFRASNEFDAVRPLEVVKLNIRDPQMPNGVLVTQYCASLDSNLDTFISETIKLLPKHKVP